MPKLNQKISLGKKSKPTLGVDIGYDSLKLALVNGRDIRKTAVIPMPQNMIREGRVVSIETMAEMIKQAIKDYGIHCQNAALVLSNETVFVRGITMPLMTIEQLKNNLPFEFRDYITNELKDYIFDYAVIAMNEPEKEEAEEGAEGAMPEDNDSDSVGATMELMAVAVQKSLIDDYREMFRKAGLKLAKAAPAVCTYQALIRAIGPSDEDEEEGKKEYCILDLGYQAIRMYMFKGDQHMVTRELEVGLSSLDAAISEAYNIDVHLAHTYLISNYENCQNQEYCVNAYGNITVELMRALNFYRFSNPDSHLEDIWICGGGAHIRPLQESIAETMDLRIHDASELAPGLGEDDDPHVLLQAIGITME